MLAKIIELSARNKFLVFLAVAFLTIWGIWAVYHTPLDAIPDLSDAQVIIFTEWTGRSPDLVEDQITYPIVSTMLAAPKVRAVRGKSFLGLSFVYVIFEDGTDIYWARSRVLEYLQGVAGKLPSGITPMLGPDATGVGWGFQYALTDETGMQDLSQLRSLQDWTLKYAIESVPGVSQVASIGGFVKQYQIIIDPNRLQAYKLSLMKVTEAVRRSNRDVEGRVVEWSGREYMVRGRGYIKDKADIEKIVVGTDGRGTPVLLSNIADVQLGPEIRRGAADLDGKGEAVGGIVVVRFGENVLSVIDQVKQKIAEITPTLPKGVKIVTTYDRSELIHRSVDTLKEEIIKLGLAVSVVCFVFLFHLPSALVVILTLPIAILISFVCMYYLRISSNIMSLSGIAIAIGAMVDASIIMVENAHKKLEDWEKAGRVHGSRTDVIINAAQEVGPSLFFSLLVITVGFLPVFTLEQQAGRLFKPLAYTKTFSMLFASFLAITLTPVLMTLFIKGKVRHEDDNPVSRVLIRLYHPVAGCSLHWRKAVILAAIVVVIVTIFPFFELGSEFMPPLYEGTLLFMPSALPGASISTMSGVLQAEDRIMKQFPEVESVFGKAGRAETATDPAPLEMIETNVTLKPMSKWRPQFKKWEDLRDEMDNALTIPGVANTWTMPIIGRIDMLSTGIKTPLGLKIFGPRLDEIERIGLEVEKTLKEEAGTRMAYAERANTGYFLDFDINRSEISRYGLQIEDVQEVIESAIGGMNLTTTVEGRERYPVNIRYGRELRDDIEKLKRVLVPMQSAEIMKGGSGSQLAHVPLGQLADIRVVRGPGMVQSEGGRLTASVTLNIEGNDFGGYVKRAQKALAEKVKVPAGYRIQWSGQYEYMENVKAKLLYVIPLTLLIIIVLIYLNTDSWIKTAIVLLAVPFSLVGTVWLLYFLGYHMSTAVWVGVIALAGLDAETGIVMLLYLDLSYNRWHQEGRINTLKDIEDSVMEGAVKRIRPKIMTVSVILAGLVPIMFSTGTGADVMKRIAAPMVGGVVTSTILELIIYPAIYVIWKERELRKSQV
ncbi:MAG TPA: CusA/CzcA family heavy metal efflux RND transporter [Nitrospirota bacterium]|nr:CusA/CzcA family heavy metal efflux RND transporter [Nitrospirota bacterium]